MLLPSTPASIKSIRNKLRIARAQLALILMAWLFIVSLHWQNDGLWSNAVMLNVPATAISLAALYHARRWMESPDEPAIRRQLYLAAGLSVTATLTHFISAVLVFVIVAWLLILGRWTLLWNRKTVFVILGAAVLVLPFPIPGDDVVFRIKPIQR
jgi:hypothetical protein